MMETTTEQVLDVRPLEPKHRHPKIFNLWKELPQGGSFVLVNDHDPIPLYYQFACEHPGDFRWDYLEQGPDTWRVRISKGDFPDPGFKPERRSAATSVSAVTFAEPLTLDTRPIFARNETPCQAIAEAVAQVIPGQTLVLLVPFEPVPLYTKLEAEGFSHQTSKLPDGTWRLEFRRESAGLGTPVACGCSH